MMDNNIIRIRYPEFLLIAQAKIEQANPNKNWNKVFDDLFQNIPKELSQVEQKFIRMALTKIHLSGKPESTWNTFQDV